MIYQHVKQRIAEIIEVKDSFNQWKQFLLGDIFPHLSSCSELVCGNVSKAIAVIVLAGEATYWPDSIDDLLEMSASSDQNCLYALMILENCHAELNEMNVKPKLRMAIKDRCEDYSPKIKSFICKLLLKEQGNANNSAMMKHLFDLTYSWIKFKVNILSIPNYPLTLFTALVKDNRSKIAEILSESIQSSSTSLQALLLKYPNEKLKDVLESKADKEELNTISHILTMINNLVMNYSNKKLNADEEDLLFHTASIFSSLCKNYIHLFFISSNQLSNSSELLMSLFLFFIANPKRKISYLFFDSISEMNLLINSQTLANLLAPLQQQSFLQFLFKVNDSILFNSKLKELKVNFDSIDSKANRKPNTSSDLDLLAILEEEDDSEVDTEDVSIQTYRKASNEAFSDLFLIIIHHYPNGARAFLEQRGSMLISMSNKRIDTNDESILKDKEYLLLVEAVLFSIRSIRYCFTEEPSMLLSFCSFILKSKMVQNERILISFIIFLDSISIYIHLDSELYVNSIHFLLSLMAKSNSLLTKIAGVVILSIIDNRKEYNQIVFDALSAFYRNNYNNYEPHTISNVFEALMKCLLLQSAISINDIFSIIIQMLSPIEAVFLSIVNGQSPDRHALIKAFEIFAIMIKCIGQKSKDLLCTIFAKYASVLFACCDKTIAANPSDNKEVRSIMTLLLIKACNYLKEHCLNHFDQINNVIYSIYTKSNEAYDVIYLMKALYIEALKCPQSPYCRIVSEKFCVICSQIYSNIMTIQKNSIETIQVFASFISSLLENIGEFPNNSFNWEIMSKVIELFLECNESIGQPQLIVYVLRAFRKMLLSRAIQADFKRKYLRAIAGSVMVHIDHYDANAIKEVRLLLIELQRIDQVLFEEGIREKVDNQIAMIVIDYVHIFGNEESKEKVEKLLTDISDVKKQLLHSSAISNYEIELKALKMNTMAINK